MTTDAWRFTPTCPVFEFDSIGDPRSPWVTYKWHSLRSPVVNVDIPPSFRCDLASVPALLLFLFPPYGSHQRAALWHDALYTYQQCDREIADAIFASIMRADKVPGWRRWLMYLAVRMFGGRAWDKKQARVGLNRERLRKAAAHDKKEIAL